MKSQVMKMFIAQIPSAICLIAAAAIAIAGGAGWGWFLFIGFLASIS